MPSRSHCFPVEGAEWELQSNGIYAIHIDSGDEHLAVWAYPSHKEYLVVRYIANVYAGPEDDMWMGPLEALCLINEAIKKREEFLNSTRAPSKKPTLRSRVS